MVRKKGFDRKEDTAERLEKLMRKLPHSEIDDLNALDTKSLKEKIVECQTNLVETQREMANDSDYLAAKNKLTNEAAPYKEAKTRLTAIMEFCALRLEGDG